MPLLRRESSNEVVALTKDRERILAYRLTPAALRRLRGSGVRVGSVFPPSILASLVRTGDAFSPQPAEAPGQNKLFEDDHTSDELPRCESTGSTADLQLVIHDAEGAAKAQLLSPEARFIVRKSTQVSLPIWILDAPLIEKLEASRVLPAATKAAAILRQWLKSDYEDAWQRLAKSHGRQTALDFGPDADELALPTYPKGVT